MRCEQEALVIARSFLLDSVLRTAARRNILAWVRSHLIDPSQLVFDSNDELLGIVKACLTDNTLATRQPRELSAAGQTFSEEDYCRAAAEPRTRGSRSASFVPNADFTDCCSCCVDPRHNWR